METRPQEKYRTTFEFWHKDNISTLMFQVQTDAKECESCEGYDMDIIKIFSDDPIHGTIQITYYCKDCNNIEKSVYPVISRRRVEKHGNSDKIDNLLKNNLQFEKL